MVGRRSRCSLVPPYGFSASQIESCHEDSVQFLKQFRQLVTEQLIGFAESAFLAEGRIIEVVGVDAQAGGDVVADQVEPSQLFWSDDCAGFGFVHQPFGESFADGIGKRCEDRLLFERKADKGDKIGKASGLRAACDLGGLGDGEGVPQTVFGPRGVIVSEFLLQFLEHGFGETLLERAAVEDLQGVDLRLVLGEVITEGLDETGSVSGRWNAKTLREQVSGSRESRKYVSTPVDS